MKTAIAAVAGAAAVLALGATAAVGQAAPPIRTSASGPAASTASPPPDDHTLYVRVGVRDVYQFEMFGPCPDIDWNQRLALVSRSGVMHLHRHGRRGDHPLAGDRPPALRGAQHAAS